MLRPALAVVLVAGLAVPVAARAGTTPALPVADPTVAAQRDTEAVVLHGSDFPGWAAPGNVTAKLPLTDLMCVQPVDGGCAHNHYVTPDADTGDVAGDGADVSRISGWRWAGSRFVEVPFQVDQVFTRYLDNSASGFAVYSGEDQHTTYQFDREGFRYTRGTCVATPDSSVATDPVTGLDTDDELAFMAADAGPQAPSSARRPHGTTGVQEVAVVDPLTRETGYVYVMLGKEPSFDAGNGYVRYQRDPDADRFALSQSSYQDYGNAAVGPYCDADGKVVGSGRRRPLDTATVTTDRYRYRYDGRWLMTDIRISSDGGTTYGPDLVDRWKARAFQQDRESKTPCCGYEEEDTHWGGSSTLLGERSGPVRTVRETWGADSGTNVVRRETFYRSEMTMKTWLRVHVIPPLDGIYAQWDFNAGRMTRFRNPQQPDGVAVDGKNDETFGNLDDPCNRKYDANDTGALTQAYRSAYVQVGACALTSPYHQSADVADPTFGSPNPVLQWSETSGPYGTIVDRYTTEARDVTPGGAPQSLTAQPYYRDDSCFDDATGTNPGPRIDLGGAHEPQTATDGTPRRCWTPADGPVDADDHFFQGDLGAHGVHLLFQVDSDNARQTVPVDEIVTSQKQVFLPGDAGNVGEQYGRAFDKPLVSHATPVSFEQARAGTTLTWSGDTSTGADNRVRLAVTLRDDDGVPVQGAAVTMTLDGTSVRLVTDAQGEAAETVKLTGRPHTRHASAVFAGDGARDGSSVDQDVADQR